MNTKKLRQKILDLAIHGKLVSQAPADEPASALLQRIRVEKERLIKEGKIKRSRKSTKTSDTPHYPQDVPFEVPEGWEWVTIGKLCSFLSRGKSPKYSEERKYPVFAQKCNLYDGDISLEQARFLDPETISKWSDEYKLIDGDILVNSTGTGTVGRTRLFHSDILGDYPFVVPDSHVSVVRTLEEIESKFVLVFLSSDYGQTYIEDNLAGSTNQKELYIGILENMQFPLPPHEEQLRIVTAVDKWFALIDTIDQGKVDLQTAIKQTKSKILDLAIHGKLVPQDPNDEPGSELLKRINPKAEITCDNEHSEKLPQNWTLAKGKNIFAPMKSTKPKDKEFQYIDIDSIDNRRQIIRKIKTIQTKNAPSRASRFTQKNDVVFSMVRPYLRNIAKVANDNCIASTGFYVCSSIPQILNSDYCYYLMTSDYVVNGLNQFMKGDNSPSINKGHIDNWLFALPPLVEQQRIVQKIETLFSVLDNIQEALEVS